MARPTDFPDWSESGDIVVPDPAKVAEGWVVGERPPAQYFNYWQNLTGQWVRNFVDELDNQVYDRLADLEARDLEHEKLAEQQSIQSLKLVFEDSAASTINDIAYGTNSLGATAQIVVVGTGGKIWSRPQGNDVWTARTAAGSYTGQWMAAIDGNLGFAIVGTAGEIQTSSDTSGWTSRHTGGNDFNDVAYKPNSTATYCAVGKAGYIWTSTNLTTWTQRFGVLGSVDLTSIEWGAGLFVVTSIDGRIQTSPDGFGWTEQTSGQVTGTSPQYLPRQLKFNSTSAGARTAGRGFVALNIRNTNEIGLSTSLDGITWTVTSSAAQTGYDEPNLRLLMLNQQVAYLGTKQSTTPYNMSVQVDDRVNSWPSYSGRNRNLYDVAPIFPTSGLAVNRVVYVVGRNTADHGVVYAGAPYLAENE